MSDRAAASFARIWRNMASGLGAKVLYLLTRLALPPFILGYLTLEQYGLWTICWIVIGYLGMGAFGVTNVYQRMVPRFLEDDDVAAINRLISTGVLVMTGLSILALGVLWLALPPIIGLFQVPPALAGDARLLLFGTALVFCLDLTLGALVHVMFGLQRIVEQNRIWVITFLIEGVAIVGLLLAGWGLWGLLAAFALRYVLGTLLQWRAVRRALPGFRLSPRLWDRASLRLLWRFGSVMQLGGILSLISYSIEKTLAAALLGVRAAAVLDLAQKFPVMASQVVSSMNQVFLPAMSQFVHRRDEASLARLYLQGTRALNGLAGVGLAFLAAFADPVLRLWLGASAPEAGGTVLALFALAYQLHILTGAASAWHRAGERPERELAYPVSQLLLVAVLTAACWALGWRTVSGLSLAVALAMALSALAYLAWTHRLVGIPVDRFARQVMIPGIAPYGLAFGLALLGPAAPGADATRWALLAFLLGAGLVYAGACGLAAFAFSTAGERAAVRARLRIGNAGGAPA